MSFQPQAEQAYLLSNPGFTYAIVCTQQLKSSASQDHCQPGTINIRLNSNGSEFIPIHCPSRCQKPSGQLFSQDRSSPCQQAANEKMYV